MASLQPTCNVFTQKGLSSRRRQAVISHVLVAIKPKLAGPYRTTERLPHGPSTRPAIIVCGIPVSGPGSSSTNNVPGAVAGQVTSELMNSMKAKICEALETDVCTVTDVYGDGRHVSIDVVSKLFQDKSSMQRQRMVYKAIWMELQEAVHAVDSMTTKTPEEAAA